MKINNLSKFLFLSLGVLSYGLFIESSDKTKSQAEVKIYKAKCDSLQHVSDSLYDELFPTQVELNRMQIAYYIFLEKNKKAAEQYGNIISEETE